MSVTRREFIGVAASAAAALIVPPVLARKSDKRLRVQPLPPIQVYCLGTDDNPVTSLDLQNSSHWIQRWQDAGDRIIGGYALYPGSVRLLNFPIPIYYEHNPCSSGLPTYIHCRHFVVERRGYGYLEVRIGSDNRPALRDDLQDIAQTLDKTLDDPRLSIVTHHNFEMKWVERTSPCRYAAVVMTHDKERSDNLWIAI